MTTRPDYFKRCVDMLEKSGGLYTIEDILDYIQQGKMQSFSTDRTWIVTQVNDFPRKRVLDIVFMVGELEDWEELKTPIEEFRKEVQADMITATGRLGWFTKYFGKKSIVDGWRPISVNFVRE